MTGQMDKARILEEMRTKYTTLEEILSPLDETQMTAAGVTGDWSIKDALAHITSWQHRLLDRLHAAARNGEPTIPGISSDEEVDKLNEQFYQQNKSRPLVEVLEDFRASYQQIVDAVQALSEEDLVNPQRFAWMQGDPLWQIVAGDTYDHYEEHAQPIREWLARSSIPG